MNSAGEPSRPTLQWTSSTYELAPLIAISPASSALLVFSRVTSSTVVLNAATGEPRQQFIRGEFEAILRRLFRLGSGDSLLSDLTQAAIEDLEGFREPGSSITYLTDQEGALITWVHADGGLATPRQDSLRIGPDNVWQWHDGTDWKGYSCLLRALARWPTLIQRLSSILSDRVRQAKAAEDVLLPLPVTVRPPFIAPTFRIGSDLKPTTLPLEKFAARLNEDVRANRGTTYLYFIHAEAGAGKTTTLLSMAHQRAQGMVGSDSIESEVTPLFLYVSARGNVLENLDQAVNAAVAETRLLTSASVRALCRNGLIIPIIDGFDELVGSATYADALSSLRPWLTALGGRGVMLVSARSSYFVSLYEDSIRRETNRDISVLHRIVELDRWSPEQRGKYVTACGIDLHRLEALRADELDLLTLPFFARACVAHLLSHRRIDAGGLLSLLIRSYVEREQGKLQSSDGAVLISAENLQAMFTELAGFMMDYNTREASLSDLHLVAESSDLKLTAGLKNRLVALCGLDVYGEGDRRFRFSHEVFLDFFFGMHVRHELSDDRVDHLRRILKRSQLTPSAARVAVAGKKLSRAFLIGLAREPVEAMPESLFRSNMGVLWAEFLSTEVELEQVEVRRADFPFHFRLPQPRGKGQMRFSECAFGSLVIPSEFPRAVVFETCSFRELRLEGKSKDCTFSSCAIDVVSTKKRYTDLPYEVAGVLESAGVTVTGMAEVSVTDGVSELTRVARMFLGKMDASVVMSIVVGADGLPEEDPRLGWIMRFSDQWKSFLRALEKHHLGYRVQVTASGNEKFRVRLELPPNEILNPSGTDARVVAFWGALA